MKTKIIFIILSFLIISCGNNDTPEKLINKWNERMLQCEIAEKMQKKKMLIDKDTTYVQNNLGKTNWITYAPATNQHGDSNLVYNYIIECSMFPDYESKWFNIEFDSRGMVVKTTITESLK